MKVKDNPCGAAKMCRKFEDFSPDNTGINRKKLAGLISKSCKLYFS
jgi:hypothetical protein